MSKGIKQQNATIHQVEYFNELGISIWDKLYIQSVAPTNPWILQYKDPLILNLNTWIHQKWRSGISKINF